MTEFDYVILGTGACLLVAFIVPVIIATWLALYDDLKRKSVSTTIINTRVTKMTIKELYEWSLKHNNEDYELMVVNCLDAEVVPVTESMLDIDRKSEQVIICS